MNDTRILISILYRTAKFFCGLMERELGCGKEKERPQKGALDTLTSRTAAYIAEEVTGSLGI